MQIEYMETDARDLDLIGPLWEKLRDHHSVLSENFTERVAGVTFDTRKKQLLVKSESGDLLIGMARDKDTNELIGYCISTISEDGVGEVESIYVEKDRRHSGIGDVLMRKALAWMDTREVKKRILAVGVGNEAVFVFYRRFNFFPKTTILEYKG